MKNSIKPDGNWLPEVALSQALTAAQCPLHRVRPITTTGVSDKPPERPQINPAQLDAKAKGLVRVSPIAPESGQIDHILTPEAISGGEL